MKFTEVEYDKRVNLNNSLKRFDSGKHGIAVVSWIDFILSTQKIWGTQVE